MSILGLCRSKLLPVTHVLVDTWKNGNGKYYPILDIMEWSHLWDITCMSELPHNPEKKLIWDLARWRGVKCKVPWLVLSTGCCCNCTVLLLASLSSGVRLTIVSVCIVFFHPLLFPHFFLWMFSVNNLQFLLSFAHVLLSSPTLSSQFQFFVNAVLTITISVFIFHPFNMTGPLQPITNC